MAKPNYSFEKRQRDLEKKRKQEEKRLRKLAEKKPEEMENVEEYAKEVPSDVSPGPVDADTNTASVGS